MLGFELPVARPGPRGHGPGAEVRVLSGLRRQLQAHGGDVSLADGNHIPAPSEHIPSSTLGSSAEWARSECVQPVQHIHRGFLELEASHPSLCSSAPSSQSPKPSS